MSTQIETRLGLTNPLKKLAYYYFTKHGFGRHPIDHNLYDKVSIVELYPWMENPEAPGEYAGGIQVNFLRENKCIRWIEFRVQWAGGGGDPAIFRVK